MENQSEVKQEELEQPSNQAIEDLKRFHSMVGSILCAAKTFTDPALLALQRGIIEWEKSVNRRLQLPSIRLGGQVEVPSTESKLDHVHDAVGDAGVVKKLPQKRHPTEAIELAHLALLTKLFRQALTTLQTLPLPTYQSDNDMCDTLSPPTSLPPSSVSLEDCGMSDLNVRFQPGFRRKYGIAYTTPDIIRCANAFIKKRQMGMSRSSSLSSQHIAGVWAEAIVNRSKEIIESPTCPEELRPLRTGPLRFNASVEMPLDDNASSTEEKGKGAQKPKQNKKKKKLTKNGDQGDGEDTEDADQGRVRGRGFIDVYVAETEKVSVEGGERSVGTKRKERDGNEDEMIGEGEICSGCATCKGDGNCKGNKHTRVDNVKLSEECTEMKDKKGDNEEDEESDADGEVKGGKENEYLGGNVWGNGSSEVVSRHCTTPLSRYRGEMEQYSFGAIGYIESAFRYKYGTPRQGAVVPTSRAMLTLHTNISADAVLGLNEFSHVWLVFVFHSNTNKRYHPKVAPPRLGGDKVGWMASRSPHRWNDIGLSLVKLDKVELPNIGATSEVHEAARKAREALKSGHVPASLANLTTPSDVTSGFPFVGGTQGCARLWLSGVDLVDGTPILDVKPYHPSDIVDSASFRIPQWLSSLPHAALTVTMSDAAELQLKELFDKHAKEQGTSIEESQQKVSLISSTTSNQSGSLSTSLSTDDDPFPQDPSRSLLQFYSTREGVKRAVMELLSMDPRPNCSKKRHSNGIYGFVFDRLNVVFCMKGDKHAEIVLIEHAGNVGIGASTNISSTTSNQVVAIPHDEANTPLRTKLNSEKWVWVAKYKIEQENQRAMTQRKPTETNP